MTCIVGIIHQGKVLLGADSATSSPESREIYVVDTPKIFKAGPFAIGCSASHQMRQVIEYAAEIGEPGDEQDLDAFMSRTFIATIRKAFERENFPLPARFNIMVGVHGKLYGVTTLFEVVQMTPVMAIGSGRHHAYGALYALRDSDKTAREKAEVALRAAQEYTTDVREPFVFVEA